MSQAAYSRAVLAIFSLFMIVSLRPVVGQTLSSNDRSAGHFMLRKIKDAIKKDYYDPTFHGVNLDERFKAADEKINQATSNGQVFGIIAQAVRSLNDSHTSFSPPPRALRVSYDWQIQNDRRPLLHHGRPRIAGSGRPSRFGREG